MKLDKNYKVRVTPEQSRKIQELLFVLGGGWFHGHDGKHPAMLNADYLFLHRSMVLTYAYEHGNCYFENKPNYTEIQADDLIALLTDLSKSAENPLQDMKLTPEFETEASEPRFKVGDKVYYRADEEIFVISDVSDFGDVQIKDWREDYHNSKYFCHATQENYERLQATFPRIEFEKPPKPLTGSDLARAMLDKGWKYVPCYVSNTSDKNAVELDDCGVIYTVNHNGNFQDGYGETWCYVVPFDLRTGEPLTESVLDE